MIAPLSRVQAAAVRRRRHDEAHTMLRLLSRGKPDCARVQRGRSSGFHPTNNNSTFRNLFSLQSFGLRLLWPSKLAWNNKEVLF